MTTPALSSVDTAVATPGRQALGQAGSRHGCRLCQGSHVSTITLGGQKKVRRLPEVVQQSSTAL